MTLPDDLRGLPAVLIPILLDVADVAADGDIDEDDALEVLRRAAHRAGVGPVAMILGGRAIDWLREVIREARTPEARAARSARRDARRLVREDARAARRARRAARKAAR